MKKRFLLGVAFASVLALTSCAKDNTPTTVKSLPLYDYNDTYTLKNDKLDTYYLADSKIPYVSISGYINSMDGALNSSAYKYSVNTLFQEYVVKTEVQGTSVSIVFDYKNDKILTTYLVAFEKTVDITSSLDYAFNLQMSTENAYAGKTLSFDLKKYGFDMRYINGNCLVPFQIMNALFGGANYLSTYYTGQSYYNTYFSLRYSDKAATQYQEILKDTSKELNTQELRDSNYNFLCFYLDYFYGLKDDKEITSFDEYLDGTIKTNLKSTDPKTYMKGYAGLVQKLNELHTSIHNYTTTESIAKYSFFEGEFEATNFKKHKTTSDALTEAAKAHYGDDLKNKVEIVGDTCYIFFKNFETSPKAKVLDSDGNILDTAYLYDTYYLFLKAMDTIKASTTPVKNIVVDLSINGGGNSGALYRTLGFISRTFRASNRDFLSHTAYTNKITVDTNNDGKYDENDQITGYNWYVLTSLYSYSSANLFAHLAKINNENVKLIGEQAGGGGCSILPLVGIDGTALQISGIGQFCDLTRNGTSYNYELLEHGRKVDYELSYDKYFDRESLTTYIDGLK